MKRAGWTRDREGMWRREVGALRLVVYATYGRRRRWSWLVYRAATKSDCGEERLVADAKAAALEAAKRLEGGAA